MENLYKLRLTDPWGQAVTFCLTSKINHERSSQKSESSIDYLFQDSFHLLDGPVAFVQ